MKAVYIILLFCFTLIIVNAKPKQDAVIQRQSTGIFDFQYNTKSNFSFPVTNYGITFLNLNVSPTLGGGYWPRGSMNQYLFAGGLWFGAKKWVDYDGTRRLKNLCEITYNPNSGLSWFVPGRFEDGDYINSSGTKQYRVYFSTDMKWEGEPIDSDDGPNWPLWKTEESNQKSTGTYIYEVEDRNENTYPLGPARISEEDIFATFKGTDLNYFEGGAAFRQNMGYPLGLQIEQTIFSWDRESMKDMIIIYYKLKNTSQDTLWQCWLSPVYDTDLATYPNVISGAANDLMRFYDEEESLNLGISWTNMNGGEVDMGYIGVSMIMTPAVYICENKFDTLINGNYYSYCTMCIDKDTISIPDDQNPGTFKDTIFCMKEFKFNEELTGFPRINKKYFSVEEQLGMRTFRRWPVDEDIVEDESRYNYMSSLIKETGLSQPGDIRMLFSTGPFNLLPEQSVSCAVQINFAMPALGGDATGETGDLDDLIEKVKLGRIFFYNEIISKVEEQERKLSNSFIVYPNPATDKIFIKHNMNRESYITIYDILGRNVTEFVNSSEFILSSSDVILSSSKDIIEFNIGNLQSGNYVILLSDRNNVISENLCIIK